MEFLRSWDTEGEGEGLRQMPSYLNRLPLDMQRFDRLAQLLGTQVEM